MKSFIRILLAAGCTYAIAAASASAQSPVYTFDEFGNSSGPGILPGTMQSDPSGGLSSPVLVYQLNAPALYGDVVLTEPGGTGLYDDSDIIRFWNPFGGNTTEIIVYSDFSTSDPPDAPADTGLPGNALTQIFVPEIGPEGNNGLVYTPAPGAPGSIPGVTVTYNFISDRVVPEPNVLAIIVAGGTLLLLMLRRRIRASLG